MRCIKERLSAECGSFPERGIGADSLYALQFFYRLTWPRARAVRGGCGACMFAPPVERFYTLKTKADVSSRKALLALSTS